MLSQLFFNALVTGSIYSLVGLGLSLILAQAKFINFSHGALVAVAPYGALFFIDQLQLNFYASVSMGILFSIAVGCLLEIFIFRPSRQANASSLILLIVSLGVYICIQNTISLTFGDSARSIRSGNHTATLVFFGGSLTLIQLATIITSFLATCCLLLLVKKTKVGAGMRAITSDPELARVFGININRIILLTFAIGSGIAGIAGILVALDVDMTPRMGMSLLVMAMVTVIFGGSKNLIGVTVGAYLLALAQQFAVWNINSQWQDAITFLVLIVFLLFKPAGLKGLQLRK